MSSTRRCKHEAAVLIGIYPATTMEWCGECGAVKKERWRKWLKPKAGGVKWPKERT